MLGATVQPDGSKRGTISGHPWEVNKVLDKVEASQGGADALKAKGWTLVRDVPDIELDPGPDGPAPKTCCEVKLSPSFRDGAVGMTVRQYGYANPDVKPSPWVDKDGYATPCDSCQRNQHRLTTGEHPGDETEPDKPDPDESEVDQDSHGSDDSGGD
jgi:hypothetical protein